MKQKDKKDKNDKRYIKLYAVLFLSVIIAFLVDNIVVDILGTPSSPILIKIFSAITLLGEIQAFTFIAVILTIILLLYRRPVLAFIMTIITSALIIPLIKNIVQRPRPFEALHVNSLVSTDLSSFPSGHAAIFFAMIPIMSKNFPKIRWIFWTIAILVGLSRIYLGVHYLSDVVCGAMIGYGIGWIFMKAGERNDWKC
jgi:undecaprenyl-diphosphatase